MTAPTELTTGSVADNGAEEGDQLCLGKDPDQPTPEVGPWRVRTSAGRPSVGGERTKPLGPGKEKNLCVP